MILSALCENPEFAHRNSVRKENDMNKCKLFSDEK